MAVNKKAERRCDKLDSNLSYIFFYVFIAEERFIPRNSISLPRSKIRRDFKTDIIMCQVTELCAICKRRSETHEFQMIKCGHPFHASCLQSLMASGRVHSCPTCRQRFRAEHVSPV